MRSDLASAINVFHDDPVGWIVATLGATPEPWQADFLRAVASNDRVAVRSGHGVGKSTALAWLILWWMATRLPAKVACTAPTGHQLEDILWAELGAWYRRSPEEFRSAYKLTGDRLTFLARPEESFAVARTARKDNPEAFQGFHSDNMLFIVDEASGVIEEVFIVGSGAMSTPNAKTVLAGNPTRRSGTFFEAFHRQRDVWHGLHVPCSASSQVGPSYATDQAKRWGVDSDVYRVRVAGEFPNASSLQFIPAQLVWDARAAEAACLLTDPLVVGVDVARFGDDRSVIAFRRGRDARTHPWLTYSGADTMKLAGIVAEITNGSHYTNGLLPDAVFVDGAGVGGGVVDRLRQLNLNPIDVNGGTEARTAEDANLRASMWRLMREWLPGAAIPDDDDLEADLVGIEYGFNARNRIQLERKEDMKDRGLSSPDMADALALTFAYPVAARTGAKTAMQRARSWDYDPLAA